MTVFFVLTGFLVLVSNQDSYTRARDTRAQEAQKAENLEEPFIGPLEEEDAIAIEGEVEEIIEEPESHIALDDARRQNPDLQLGDYVEEPMESILFGRIAAQTAKGAASLLTMGCHPEHEIDRITTPRGCTIAGLNRMEHEGFSSAMIRGITVSADNAAKLYINDES